MSPVHYPLLCFWQGAIAGDALPLFRTYAAIIAPYFLSLFL